MGWTIVGTVIAAFAGAAFGGFLRDWLVEKYFGPRLSIEEESVVPFDDFYGHRLLVRNKGKRAANNCIGMVTIDNVTPQEDILDSVPFSRIMTKASFTNIKDMSVCWARLGNREDITINRDTSQTLDLYRVQKSNRSLQIPTEDGWVPLRIALRADKKYKGVIKITSANAEPATAKFELLPQENGDVKLNIMEREER